MKQNAGFHGYTRVYVDNRGQCARGVHKTAIPDRCQALHESGVGFQLHAALRQRLAPQFQGSLSLLLFLTEGGEQWQRVG